MNAGHAERGQICSGTRHSTIRKKHNHRCLSLQGIAPERGGGAVHDGKAERRFSGADGVLGSGRIRRELSLSCHCRDALRSEAAVLCTLAKLDANAFAVAESAPASEQGQQISLVVAEGVEVVLPLAGGYLCRQHTDTAACEAGKGASWLGAAAGRGCPHMRTSLGICACHHRIGVIPSCCHRPCSVWPLSGPSLILSVSSIAQACSTLRRRRNGCASSRPSWRRNWRGSAAGCPTPNSWRRRSHTSWPRPSSSRCVGVAHKRLHSCILAVIRGQSSKPQILDRAQPHVVAEAEQQQVRGKPTRTRLLAVDSLGCCEPGDHCRSVGNATGRQLVHPSRDGWCMLSSLLSVRCFQPCASLDGHVAACRRSSRSSWRQSSRSWSRCWRSPL